jgi:steroid delta-isomerase-like uncharacterized protein
VTEVEMGHDENARIATSFHQAWNDRDFDRLASFMADDGEIVLVGSGTSFRGPEGGRQYAQMWADGFPDGEIQTETAFSQGENVAVTYTGRGTHTGTLRSPTGEIPATGRSVTLELCDVFEIRNGKISSLRQYFDSASLLAQIGALEATAGAPGP